MKGLTDFFQNGFFFTFADEISNVVGTLGEGLDPDMVEAFW
jgi:hypothetical protein